MNFYMVVCGLLLILASAQAFWNSFGRGRYFSPNAGFGLFPYQNYGYGYNRFGDNDGPDFDDYYPRGFYHG